MREPGALRNLAVIAAASALVGVVALVGGIVRHVAGLLVLGGGLLALGAFGFIAYLATDAIVEAIWARDEKDPDDPSGS